MLGIVNRIVALLAQWGEEMTDVVQVGTLFGKWEAMGMTGSQLNLRNPRMKQGIPSSNHILLMDRIKGQSLYNIKY